MKLQTSSSRSLGLFAVSIALLLAGCGGGGGGSNGQNPATAPAVSISAQPPSVAQAQPVTLTVTATNATQVVISDNLDKTTFTLPGAGGTQTVMPAQTTTYTATASGAGNTSAVATVVVTVTNAPPSAPVQHILFMLQENRTFDSYFGMLNPYRQMMGFNVGDDGKTYDVDGIEDKLALFPNQSDPDPNGIVHTFNLFKTTSTCLDDMSSAWLESYGDVNRFDFSLNRQMKMDGFVHTAQNFAINGNNDPNNKNRYTDLLGQRAMAFYDQDVLNYYYYMASQFAVSDRWFSPVASKSTPNRIATISGGTTNGLVRDPGLDDHIGGTPVKTIFQELDENHVTWRIYYGVTVDNCRVNDPTCLTPGSKFPASTFTAFPYGRKYLYPKTLQTGPLCTPPLTTSKVAVGDPNDGFCVDPIHIAPLTQYFSDVQNATLAQFTFLEPEFGYTDEHPGSGQSISKGQIQSAKVLSALLKSPSWSSSVFFLAYDEGGGPFDHVPPVPGKSNTFTDAAVAQNYPDISTVAVNADNVKPCLPPMGIPAGNCDLLPNWPGAAPTDAPAILGFAAQLGFRVPNMIVSPFTRKHLVFHAPMDHTAVLRFVEDTFIHNGIHLTPRVAAQPDLSPLFDFTAQPWATPPANIPVPAPEGGTCHASVMQ